MARLLPLVWPALMSRLQAAIAVSAAAFSSLQTDQSSANAGARPPAIRNRKARAARRGMANLWVFHPYSRSGHDARQLPNSAACRIGYGASREEAAAASLPSAAYMHLSCNPPE